LRLLFICPAIWQVGAMANLDHPHDHDHAHGQEPLSDVALRVKALESLMVENYGNSYLRNPERPTSMRRLGAHRSTKSSSVLRSR
jgi:hypothetical protein